LRKTLIKILLLAFLGSIISLFKYYPEIPCKPPSLGVIDCTPIPASIGFPIKGFIHNDLQLSELLLGLVFVVALNLVFYFVILCVCYFIYIKLIQHKRKK